MILARRKFICIATVISACILLQACTLFSFLNAGKPRKAKNEVKVIRDIGWWPKQAELQVDSFKVSIVKSQLSLFNSHSLLAYRVKGRLSYKGSYVPFIRRVHVSETRLSDEVPAYAKGLNNAEIRITPVVDSKEVKGAQGGTVHFDFTNELNIESMGWGENSIRFLCGSVEQVVVLDQRK